MVYIARIIRRSPTFRPISGQKSRSDASDVPSRASRTKRHVYTLRVRRGVDATTRGQGKSLGLVAAGTVGAAHARKPEFKGIRCSSLHLVAVYPNWPYIAPVPPPTIHLTTAQVIAAVERLDGETLPARTLSDWAYDGIVVPSVRFERRRGRYNVRLYNLSDLARVRVVVRLRRAGVSLAQVRVICAYLDGELREVLKPKTRAALLFDGRRAYVTRPGTAAVDVPSGQLRLELVDCVAGNEQAARVALRTA